MNPAIIAAAIAAGNPEKLEFPKVSFWGVFYVTSTTFDDSSQLLFGPFPRPLLLCVFW